jgi:hypothetical protein
MKRIKIWLASVGVVLFALIPAVPASAQINVFDDACKVKGSQSSEACNVTGANPITGSGGTISKVSRLIGFIAGMSAIVLMIIGGIMYILSSGDPGKVTAARNTVLYAAIGLAVVLVAQGIIVFVLNKV